MTNETTETIYRRAWYEGQIGTYCQMVRAGKPVASSQLPTALLTDMQALCQAEGCLVYAEACEGAPEWSVLFMYQRPFMLQIIKHSMRFDDSSPLHIWFKGCMYGYPLANIDDYLGKDCDELPPDTGSVALGARRQGLPPVDDDGVAATSTLIPAGDWCGLPDTVDTADGCHDHSPLRGCVSREICKLCYHVNAVGFSVPDEVWQAVVPEHVRDKVVCLACFTRLADEKLIPWDRQIEFFPVSMAARIVTP